MNCCPHCSGRTGFTFYMTVKYDMIGEWGEKAEAGDSTTTTRSLAVCLDCKTKMRAETAERAASTQEGSKMEKPGEK